MIDPEHSSESTESTDGIEDGLREVIPRPTKTPLYQATHAPRYQRQALIKHIEENTGRQLICYVAGAFAPIEREDTVGFIDLLHNVIAGRDLDVLLHTGGGDIDAAEKLITLARNKVGAATLRIVVPDYAKSAGTLMALGADIVVMSDSSELGPIDPQYVRADQHGNRTLCPIQSYLDAYEEYKAALEKDPNNVGARIMLEKLDPATVKLFQATMKRARTLAENLLKRGMFRNSGNWSQTVNELLNRKRWHSHSQMISHEDAQDSKIGLTVDVLASDGTEWQNYWQLHCLQRLAVGDREKLFESNYVSLCIDCAKG